MKKRESTKHSPPNLSLIRSIQAAIYTSCCLILPATIPPCGGQNLIRNPQLSELSISIEEICEEYYHFKERIDEGPDDLIFDYFQWDAVRDHPSLFQNWDVVLVHLGLILATAEIPRICAFNEERDIVVNRYFDGSLGYVNTNPSIFLPRMGECAQEVSPEHGVQLQDHLYFYYQSQLIVPLRLGSSYYYENVFSHRIKDATFRQPAWYYKTAQIRFSAEDLTVAETDRGECFECFIREPDIRFIDQPGTRRGLVGACFTAEGGERFIQLGDFSCSYHPFDTNRITLETSSAWQQYPLYIDNLQLWEIDNIPVIRDSLVCVDREIDFNPAGLQGLVAVIDGDTMFTPMNLPIGDYVVDYYLYNCGWIDQREFEVTDTCTVCGFEAINPIDTLLCPGEVIDIPQFPPLVSTLQDGRTIYEFSEDIPGEYLLDYVQEDCGLLGQGHIRIAECAECFDFEEEIRLCRDEAIILHEIVGRNLIFEVGGMIENELILERDTALEVVVLSNDCFEVGRFRLIAEKCSDCNVFIPDAFSPNGDDINDEFTAFFECGEIVAMAIFNRWGKQIFQSTFGERSWNGEHQGEPAESGVYVYVVHYRDGHSIQSKILQRSGSVTLVR